MGKLNEAMDMQELKAKPAWFPGLTFRGLLPSSTGHLPSNDTVSFAQEEQSKGATDPARPLLDHLPLPSHWQHPTRQSQLMGNTCFSSTGEWKR